MNKGILAIFVMLSISEPLAQDISGQDLLDKMRVSDAAFLESQTLVFRMEGPAGGPHSLDSGRKSQKVTLTRHKGAMAIKREISYTEAPAYRPKTSDGQAVDYDMDGRLIVWRQTCERSLIEPDFQGHETELVCLMISPDGEVTEEYGARPVFDIYQPADTQRYFLSWNPILATGRGFSKHLSKVVEVKEAEGGLVSIRAEGFLHPKTRGTWEVVVEPELSCIVRSASFTAGEASQSSFDLVTSGTKSFGDFTLAEWGLGKTVHIEDYRAEPDTALLDECRKMLRGPYPAGSRVHDWTIDPKGPSVYIAGDTETSDNPNDEMAAEESNNALLDNPGKGSLVWWVVVIIAAVPILGTRLIRRTE